MDVKFHDHEIRLGKIRTALMLDSESSIKRHSRCKYYCKRKES